MMHLMKHLLLFALRSFGFNAWSFRGVEIRMFIAIEARKQKFWEMVCLAGAREMSWVISILTEAKPCYYSKH